MSVVIPLTQGRYDAAARELFGDYARPNFPEEAPIT